MAATQASPVTTLSGPPARGLARTPAFVAARPAWRPLRCCTDPSASTGIEGDSASTAEIFALIMSGAATEVQVGALLMGMRARGETMPVVILTAAIDDYPLTEAMSLGVNGIVMKNDDPACLAPVDLAVARPGQLRLL